MRRWGMSHMSHESRCKGMPDVVGRGGEYVYGGALGWALGVGRGGEGHACMSSGRVYIHTCVYEQWQGVHT